MTQLKELFANSNSLNIVSVIHKDHKCQWELGTNDYEDVKDYQYYLIVPLPPFPFPPPRHLQKYNYTCLARRSYIPHRWGPLVFLLYCYTNTCSSNSTASFPDTATHKCWGNDFTTVICSVNVPCMSWYIVKIVLYNALKQIEAMKALNFRLQCSSFNIYG